MGALGAQGALAGGKSHLSSTSPSRPVPGDKTRVGGCLAVTGAPSSCHVLFQVRATPVGPPSLSPGQAEVEIHRCQEIALLRTSSRSLCFHPHVRKPSAPPRRGRSESHERARGGDGGKALFLASLSKSFFLKKIFLVFFNVKLFIFRF